MTDLKISQLPDGGGPQAADLAPAVRNGGNYKVSLAAAPALSTVLSTDLIQVVRNGVVYLAALADVLVATTPGSGAGTLDFSDPDNSAYAALI